ncbi:MAG: DUF308 domain-containing protein [Caldilineaceae bacterium]|nr:DUF308 domain-containing protein [Caldilineaceae bacterium]
MSTATMSIPESIRNYWWILLFQGLAALGFGLVLLFQPAATLVVLTTFMGAYWLIDGIFKVIGAVSGQSGDRSWWLLLLSGLLGIIGGLIVLSQPILSTLITQIFFVYMLAAQAFIGGVLSIIWAVRVRKEIRGEGWIIVGGFLAILLAILLLAAPVSSILIVAWMTALIAIGGGIGLMIAAVRLRNQPV